MENLPDQETTKEIPPIRSPIIMQNLPRQSLKNIFGFDGYRPEDRWLWFAIRMSLVLFMIGVEVVIIAAFAKVMLAL